ncbi:hypothetical protein PR048_023368 [Dryococelus australis]|uniref:Uncharacterized protein n=1 Tax=Dryococelus australis TaxID=614101 RepID=A0ABQ9GTW2_9NEOP|nr:hypothetical protein PR048_023368 [Dryococelus australis]
MPLVDGFSRGSPVSQPLNSDAVPYPPRFTPSGSQDFDVNSRTPLRSNMSLWSSAEMKGRGKREIPEKTRRPKASSGTIPTCENPEWPGRGLNPDSLDYLYTRETKNTENVQFNIGSPFHTSSCNLTNSNALQAGCTPVRRIETQGDSFLCQPGMALLCSYLVSGAGGVDPVASFVTGDRPVDQCWRVGDAVNKDLPPPPLHVTHIRLPHVVTETFHTSLPLRQRAHTRSLRPSLAMAVQAGPEVTKLHHVYHLHSRNNSASHINMESPLKVTSRRVADGKTARRMSSLRVDATRQVMSEEESTLELRRYETRKVAAGRRGTVVAERLACRSSHRRTESNPGPGHRIFACANHAGRYYWSADFLGDLPFPPPFNSRCSNPTSITLIDSQDLAVKSRGDEPCLIGYCTLYNSYWIGRAAVLVTLLTGVRSTHGAVAECKSGDNGNASRKPIVQWQRPPRFQRAKILTTQPGLEPCPPWREASCPPHVGEQSAILSKIISGIETRARGPIRERGCWRGVWRCVARVVQGGKVYEGRQAEKTKLYLGETGPDC